MNYNWALVSPLANEADSFDLFIKEIKKTLDKLGTGVVYFVVDNATKDNTLDLCRELEKEDSRFFTIWAPENKNVVDAYIRGYKEALKGDYEYIVEMDGGLSHDPCAIPMFLRNLSEGHNCVYGSRFINGGSIFDSNWRRTFLSRNGTFLSNILLGTKMKDMTSGFMAFHRDVAIKLVRYKLLSKAHFYQTEVRYLLRNERTIEVPIHYMAPSPRVSKKAIYNSFAVLFHYFFLRVCGKAVRL